ncbi:hypothetical protein O5Y58_07655 [Microbacterium paraoxydans]|uniref:hypothetical protein n=1 Tax=Microbacterium TaxID=33882 RepID=UPI000C7FEAC7|nr:hypothetical protein [Microbacterium sp. UMB0228]PMC02358.1 hypothetical protein CJ226_15485 [Microbacterium sp. UMB0228]
MFSVTERIKNYNSTVGQPRGGLLPLKLMDVVEYPELGGVLDGAEENLHGSAMGNTVDLLLRLRDVCVRAHHTCVNQAHQDAGTWQSEFVRRASEVFKGCLGGALVISAELEASAKDLVTDVLVASVFHTVRGEFDDLMRDEVVIHSTYKLSTFLIGAYGHAVHYNPATTETLPDEFTTQRIIELVQRAVHVLESFGGATKSGFVFADRERYVLGDRGGYTDLVSRGDGDFLTRDTLWDCKVSMAKFTKDYTLQVLMYFLMGKESGLEEFAELTHIGLFNPRRNEVVRMAVADIPAEIIQTVRRDVIGYDLEEVVA